MSNSSRREKKLKLVCYSCDYMLEGIFENFCKLSLKERKDDDTLVPKDCPRKMELLIVKQGVKDGIAKCK